MTESDVSSWLDGFMPYALQSADIAGAVVVVVKDGAALVQKGYGYADVASRHRVDPDATLFRTGSIAKLFTWTSVMQLVEQNKLDLDHDINAYLDFTIPRREGKPITLRQLMTHTAGFEERSKNLITTDPTRLAPLGDALKRWIPERVFAPGSTPSYSNYGTALAGYIVERVSGVPFQCYVREHIFEPLGMEHSTFSQPPPAALQALTSKGYASASGAPKPREFLELVPAGAMVTTGSDMARFMIAHLQDGRYADVQILRPETAREMHDTPYTVIPGLHRMLLGFYEHDIEGHRVIAHAGDSQWFHGELNLYVDDNLGLFVALNSAGNPGSATALRTALFEEFTRRYLPAQCARLPSQTPTARAHGRMISGLYENSRASRSSFRTTLDILDQTQVLLNADDSITLPRTKGMNGKPKRWREIAPFLWEEAGGHLRLAAEVSNGRVVRFGIEPSSPYSVYERVPWWRSSSWLVPAFWVASTVLMVNVLAWFAFILRRYSGASSSSPPFAPSGRVVGILGLVALLTLAGWRALMSRMQADIDLMSSRTDGWLIGLQVLGLIAFVGSVAACAWDLLRRLHSPPRWEATLWSGALAIAAALILWVAIVCNLIRLSVDY